MPKLTASSGTNQYKEIGGGQGLKKTLGADYITSVTYDSIFEFAKAQNIYYAESTAKDRAQVYQSYDGQYVPYKDVAEDNSLKTLQDVSKHTLELLVNTCKEEVNKNIKLTHEKDVIKNKLTVSLDKNVMLTLENKLLKQGSIVNGKQLNDYCIDAKDVIEENVVYNEKRLKRLDEAKKNRKDKNYQQEITKISLLLLAGICLFGIINYL
jgi:hypothetical protein